MCESVQLNENVNFSGYIQPKKYSSLEAAYILQFLQHDSKSNKVISWTQKLEELFCQKLGVKYAIACNSGTSALHMALKALGIGSGDEVIMPALTVVMDAYAIIHCGATPVYADVDEKTFIIDPKKIEAAITKNTKAIITVSLQGLPVDMDPIREIANRYNIFILEDSAQTILGTDKGRMAGTLGDIGIYSFENKKHLTAGSEGGMVVTNNEELAVKARKFGGIGYKHMTATSGRTCLSMSQVQDPDYERFDTIGLNYRMPEICAAVGLGQLERLDELVARRQQVAALFLSAIEGCDWLVPQFVPNEFVNSYYTFAVVYHGAYSFGLTWKEFYNVYIANGGDGFYGACVIPYLEPALRDFHKVSLKGKCFVAEKLQKQIMQFKTNYRDLSLAKKKANALRNLIESIEKSHSKKSMHLQEFS